MDNIYTILHSNWGNHNDYERKRDYPPKGQGLRHVAYGLRWTRKEPPVRGHHEWESFPPRRRPFDDPPRCCRRGKGPLLVWLRWLEGRDAQERRNRLTQHPLRGRG